MKRILNISLWVLLVAGLAVSLGFVNKERKDITVKSIGIRIDHSEENYFVDNDDIEKILFRKGDTLVGKVMGAIQYNDLEKIIMKNPAVENAEVYATLDGDVKVDVVQRRPIVRVYSRNGESFYIDDRGDLMPLSSKFASRVPIANGNISASYIKMYKQNMNGLNDSLASSTQLDEIFRLAQYLEENEFLNAQMQQIYITENKEIELVPRVGLHKILIGDINDLDSKFNKLKILYDKGLSKAGWNQYSYINLKYKNQVICTKRK